MEAIYGAFFFLGIVVCGKLCLWYVKRRRASAMKKVCITPMGVRTVDYSGRTIRLR